MKNKTLAITGAAGKKTGGAFVSILSNNLETISKIFPGGIKALVMEEEKDSLKDYDFLDVYPLNFNEKEKVIEILKDVDTVINIANIRLSRVIVDAAIENKIKRLILVHTTGVYSKFKDASKEYKEIDDYVYKKCSANNIKLTICRPTMIYGNKHDNNMYKFIKMVDKLPIMPLVNGAMYELQPVHYEDVAGALYSILINEKDTTNKDYNISGDKPIYLKDIFSTIGKYLGKNVKYLYVPYFLAYGGSLILYYLSMKKIDIREKVQRLCETRKFDHDLATKDFRFSPRTFEEGIEKEIKHYLESIKK